MELKLLKCDWGMEHLGSARERLEAYAKAGYDGVEASFIDMEPEELRDCLAELKLDHVAMVFARDEAEFAEQLKRVRRVEPLLVNCHPGRDHFDFERGKAFFRTAMSMARDTLGCEVVFETHRQTLLYAPWTTSRYLDAIPDLRLAADFSHFTCVSETDMHQLGYAIPSPTQPGRFAAERRVDPVLVKCMDDAIRASHHIHARVGTAHGPQAADPTHGDGLVWTETFEGWWDRIIENRAGEGRDFLTINPEFGPPPYAPADPATGEAFIDVWEVCLWMTQRFRERWAGRLGGDGVTLHE